MSGVLEPKRPSSSEEAEKKGKRSISREEVGSFVKMDGLKTYVTGEPTVKKGLLFIYDIFGFRPQSLQGADILASTHKYLVAMPDFHRGDSIDPSFVPPDTEEKKARVQEFRAKSADHGKALETLDSVMQVLRDSYPNITSWGVIAYCWGSEVAVRRSFQGSQFVAAVLTSPSQIDPEEATKVAIPMAVLASKNEPVDSVAHFEKNLKVPTHVETFSSQVHGFMSARANLKDETVMKEYERGYKVALDFLDKHFV